MVRPVQLAWGIFLVLVALLASAWSPYDRATWWMEVFPVMVAVPLLWAYRHRFPLTHLLGILIFWHALILILGGTHTYARVPLGQWVADVMGWQRNPYDKLGHFFQGLVPALLTREILSRSNGAPSRSWLRFLSVCVALAFSAFYELIEWWAALALGQGADEFLGTQGDPWDTPSDMFLALLGALVSVFLLGKWHDRQLRVGRSSHHPG
ncbi:MAG: DUF2238 domain-containing protein [Verrucomicrobiales bacterium]